MRWLCVSVLAVWLCAASARAADDRPKFGSTYHPGAYTGIAWSSKTVDAALKDKKPVVLFVYFDQLADKRPNNIAFNIEIRCLADPKLKEALGAVTLIKMSGKVAVDKLGAAFPKTAVASLFVIDLTGRPIYAAVDQYPSAGDFLPILQQAVATVKNQEQKGVVAEPVMKPPTPAPKKDDPAKKPDDKAGPADDKKGDPKDDPKDEPKKKKKPVVDDD